MEKYAITNDRADYVAGVTAARERYNADNPGKEFKTNQEYVAFVMDGAFRSYATQYNTLDTKLDPVAEDAG